jgi:hypothetical protein
LVTWREAQVHYRHGAGKNVWKRFSAGTIPSEVVAIAFMLPVQEVLYAN